MQLQRQQFYNQTEFEFDPAKNIQSNSIALLSEDTTVAGLENTQKRPVMHSAGFSQPCFRGGTRERDLEPVG